MTLEGLSVCIVICHPFPEIKGGEERFLKYFSEFLQNRNIRYTIVSSIPKSNTPNIVGVGISPFRLPLVGFTPYFLLFSFIAGMRIIGMNKHRSFSLIHSIDTGYSGLAGLYASKILGIKFIAHSHCCRASALKLIVLLRNGIAKHFISPFSKFESSIDTLVSRNADHLMVVSNEIKQYISNLGVPFKKISVIPMGIETSRFKPMTKDRKDVRQEFGIPENAFVIGYIGRIGTPDKRLQTLIEAFSIFNHQTCTNSYLMIVGNGNHNEYDNKIKEMGVTSVIFTGFRQDIERMLAALDVFVLPSLSEGCQKPTWAVSIATGDHSTQSAPCFDCKRFPSTIDAEYTTRNKNGYRNLSSSPLSQQAEKGFRRPASASHIGSNPLTFSIPTPPRGCA
jgi:glycosyltransferase involved in cell wall biosynthesis